MVISDKVSLKLVIFIDLHSLTRTAHTPLELSYYPFQGNYPTTGPHITLDKTGEALRMVLNVAGNDQLFTYFLIHFFFSIFVRYRVVYQED